MYGERKDAGYRIDLDLVLDNPWDFFGDTPGMDAEKNFDVPLEETCGGSTYYSPDRFINSPIVPRPPVSTPALMRLIRSRIEPRPRRGLLVAHRRDDGCHEGALRL